MVTTLTGKVPYVFALVIESPEWTSLALNKVAVTEGGYRIRWILHNECN